MVTPISNEYEKSFLGLTHLSNRVRSFATSLPEKLSAMEEKYLQENPLLYKNSECKRLKYFREAFTYKYYLSVMHLEQLWALKHVGQYTLSLNDLLINIFDYHQTAEDRLLLSSFVVEGFIIQGNAFLDFFMLYILTTMKISTTNRLKKDKFIKKLDGVTHDKLKVKADEVKEYFDQNVLNTSSIHKNWGFTLNTLRDSIVHRDLTYPDFDTGETLLAKLPKFGVGTSSDEPAFEYFQNIQNNMFYLVTELASSIYDLEWKPGPYKPGLW